MRWYRPFAIFLVSGSFVVALIAAVQGDGASPTSAVTADEALKDLMDGNARFAKGEATSPRRTPADFRGVAEYQSPIAVVIACADSRVAPELLFDSGVGELFVIRVAGNVVNRAGVTV